MKMKRSFAAFSALALGALLVSSCASAGQEAPTPTPAVTGVYQKITAEQAQSMMEESESFVLLDVRTQEEYIEAHIEGAVLLPNDEIGTKADTALPDKTAQIFVYCRSGRRSAEAANKLVELGYTNVYDFGGIIDWPYGTVSG